MKKEKKMKKKNVVDRYDKVKSAEYCHISQLPQESDKVIIKVSQKGATVKTAVISHTTDVRQTRLVHLCT